MKKNRDAIALIELIFAITIMGIALLSAPVLISQATSSAYVSMQQESVATAAAQVNMIMTSEWDELDTNTTRGEPVLRTISTIFNQCDGTTDHPRGVTAASGRYCKTLNGDNPPPFATTAAKLGKEAGEFNNYFDDIDDYDGNISTINIYQAETYTTNMGDYIDKNITVTSEIFYGNDHPKKADGTSAPYAKKTYFSNPFEDINDTPPSTSTNIKLISVVLTTTNPATELSKTIRVSAFMCNIGAPKKRLISNEGSL